MTTDHYCYVKLKLETWKCEDKQAIKMDVWRKLKQKRTINVQEIKFKLLRQKIITQQCWNTSAGAGGGGQ
jgi:metal-sulfur cluster biosynthetic enzyme